MKLLIRHWTLVVVTLFAGISGISAQYVGLTSLHMQDKYGFNPAYGGMERSLALGLHYRTQWAGLPGNPEYRALTAHMPMYVWQGGVGIRLANESVGAERHTTLALSYNYVIQSTIGAFSIGLRPGLLQQRLDGTQLRAPEGNYEGSLIDHLDGNLPNGVVSGSAFQLDAGLYFVGNRLEAGLAWMGWVPGGLQLGEGLRYRPLPALGLSGEYRFDLTEAVTLYPGVLIRSDLRQYQGEAYARVTWNGAAQGMIGWRGGGGQAASALVLGAGVRISGRFMLYYAYDLSLGGLAGNQQGTHEVLLRYNLGEKIGAGLPPRVIYNPRNL